MLDLLPVTGSLVVAHRSPGALTVIALSRRRCDHRALARNARDARYRSARRNRRRHLSDPRLHRRSEPAPAPKNCSSPDSGTESESSAIRLSVGTRYSGRGDSTSRIPGWPVIWLPLLRNRRTRRWPHENSHQSRARALPPRPADAGRLRLRRSAAGRHAGFSDLARVTERRETRDTQAMLTRVNRQLTAIRGEQAKLDAPCACPAMRSCSIAAFCSTR